MRRMMILTLVLSFLLAGCFGGSEGGIAVYPVYTYSSVDTPRVIPDEGVVFSDIWVARAPAYVSKVTVKVVIVHTYVSDLDLILISPEGTVIYLTDNDSDGEDFWYTTFDDAALRGIWLTNSLDDPRTGYYQPNEPLDWLYGEHASGLWTLEVVDEYPDDDGFLIEWSIDIQ